VFVAFSASMMVAGGEWPRELQAYRGTTPKVDGVIDAGEWDDAVKFEGVKGWTPQFSPTTNPGGFVARRLGEV
jgi:hypothetical protein